MGPAALAAGGTVDDRIAGMIRQAYESAERPPRDRGVPGIPALQAKLYGASADDPRTWADLAHALVNVEGICFCAIAACGLAVEGIKCPVSSPPADPPRDALAWP